MAVLLEARGLSCAREQDQIFSELNLQVNEGDTVIIQGPSGCGKTTLLKCLAHLNVYSGQVLYKGKTPKSYSIPFYRTQVLYVPQKPSFLPGTPRDFLTTVHSFSSRKSSTTHKSDMRHPIEVSHMWGIDKVLWDRAWADLSGGEAQRINLAIAVGLDAAEILLLDEPTSALDPHSSSLVENFLASEIKSSESCLKALVWITHSEEQGRRVGTRFIRIVDGGAHEEVSSV